MCARSLLIRLGGLLAKGGDGMRHRHSRTGSLALAAVLGMTALAAFNAPADSADTGGVTEAVAVQEDLGLGPHDLEAVAKAHRLKLVHPLPAV